MGIKELQLNNKGRRNELSKLKQKKRAMNFGIESGPFFNKLKHTAKCCSCFMCSPTNAIPYKMKHSDLIKSAYID